MENYKIDEKYSLSIFHFNLQYVAGNLKTYHHLHKHSMRPFLRFFDRHPDWAASCEIQGHYIAFMKKFYPQDLALLRKLNKRDQVEMVSVHYSDQIYPAYPERDLQQSIDFNDEIFQDADLHRSKVWFGQENFFGQGIAERIMERNNYETALLNNHFVWHHDNNGLRKAPYWRFHGVDHDRINYLHSSGQGYESESEGVRISQRFSYWDDAELAFGTTPYAPFLAKPREQYINQFNKYTLLEREGYKIVRVSDYIDRVRELGLKPEEGPFLTDATWNTRYYGGTYLWMGYYRLPWEKDARIRSLTYRTRSDLLAVEGLVNWAIKSGNVSNTKQIKSWLKMAWKHQLLAEVSDSTGQQPAPIEIKYSFSECEYCDQYLGKIIQSLKSQLSIPKKFYDTLKEEFVDSAFPADIPSEKVAFSEIAKLFPTAIQTIGIKNGCYVGYRVNDEFGKENRHYILDFKFSSHYTPFFKRVMSFFRDGEKKPEFTKKFDYQYGNYAGINFPMWEDKVSYCSACTENILRDFPADEFDFKRTWLPLPNGLVGIGNDTFIIKHNSVGETDIACTLNFEQERGQACFNVLNPYRGATYHWRYSIFKGTADEVLRIANKLNVFPTREIC